MGPDRHFISEDDRGFAAFFPDNARLERIATGFVWAEGPVWLNDIQELRFSDIPNNRMMTWSEARGLRVFRQPSQWANGNTLDRGGAMVSCEHGGRCVSRTGADGSYEVLATNWQGKRLNSPNDVVVKSDGSIWFTDPPYGIISYHEGIRADSEIGSNNVYRVDPHSGAVERVADDFDRPNGLAFSPDESTLYIVDSGRSRGHGFGFDDTRPQHVRAFDVIDGRKLANSRVVTEVDRPDGLRVDTEGLLWVSAVDGVHCYTPSGTRVGRILVPEVVANLTFGGPKKSRLFITATSSVYSVETNRQGAQTP